MITISRSLTLSFVATTLVATAACSDDAIEPIDQEVITTVTLTFTPTGGGAPVVVAYDDPDDPGTTDQYTLGGDILVAPVLEPGATTRRVRFPAGCWVAPDGARFDGPDVRSIPVTLTSVPWYRRA